MGKVATGFVAGGKARPGVDAFVELLGTLWEEELVGHRAVVSVGPVRGESPVTGAGKAGAGREIRWKGEDLAGLQAAVRAAYGEDVAVWFDKVDLDAFEPAEEEEYEDVEDEGDEGEDDEPVSAAPRAAAPASDDDGLGEFELVPPSMCLYSVRTPVDLGVGKLGARAAWAVLDGEDMSFLVDDLDGSWLLDVLEESLGPVKVGKRKG